MITEKMILDMGVILAVAMLLGAVLERYKFPAVLGYILAGVLVGPLLGWVQSSEVLELFSEVGVIMLLFYIGLELDPDRLREGGLAAFILGPLKMAVNFGLGFLVGLLFGLSTIESAFLGFIIMMSSTAIVGKYLMDKNEMKTLEASISITMLLMEDFAAVLVLAVLGSAGSNGSISAVILTSVAIVLVFIYVISEYSKYVLSFIERFEYRKHISLYALGIVFFLSYLVSFFGLPAAIGAFLAGYLMSRMGHHELIEKELGTFRDFFSAFFFVSVGMLFVVPNSIISFEIILLLLVTSVLGTYISCGLVGQFLGLGSDLSSKLSSLMVPIGEFSLIIATLAFNLHLPHAQDILNSAVSLGLLTAFVMPYAMEFTPAFSQFLARLPSSKRLSLAGSLFHAARSSREMHQTITNFFRVLGMYLIAGFSVIYLITIMSAKIEFTIFGYTSAEIFRYLAIAFLIPVLYGIVMKVRWLGIRLVGIAGPSLFPDLKAYHVMWMQFYLADLLTGFTLVIMSILLGWISVLFAKEYVILPLLIFALGIVYAGKGYWISMESYEKIKKGIRTKKRMHMVGGRLGRRFK